ncbi:carbohydrate-binding module family 21 protein [Neolentinus lepideus HHB14362 ss-1]|uniref:Carbohydrate-binding module family 21 protein n=1 Tax=Neolentinus lepideus HHB14362 ss-1 TaxID=1314782 RepID=A0A165RN34_9AGAM|nr:carbohydrate-binding module family 21 protein [Neolentinus lepideus HHB14362 ss-1]
MITASYPSSPSMEALFNRDSNSAGAALPSIPRRLSSSGRSRPQTSAPASSTVLVVQPPTPDLGSEQPSTPATLSSYRLRNADASEGSTSSPKVFESTQINVAPRPKRIRGHKLPLLWPPEDSTPTPSPASSRTKGLADLTLKPSQTPQPEPRAVSPVDPSENASDTETPRASQIHRHTWSGRSGHSRLRIKSETAIPSERELLANTSIESTSSTPTQSITMGMTPSDTPTIRKKSGEIVKSSLKSRTRQGRPDLSVITDTPVLRSEPTTPNRSVHFSRQLEQVKLFLAEQKPLAVSRDGSPTDTSEADSDFPSFIYGSADEKQTMKVLVMHVVNMPHRTVSAMDAEVALEELVLSRENSAITGLVKVKNLAFEKRVAVRFTFDDWQTTSEVTGKYVESTEGGAYDRFSFIIRLSDILSRIEQKMLHLAVHYTAAGREIWDNNSGANYQAKFSKSQPIATPTSESDGEKSSIDGADLHSKLEKVAKGRETIGAVLANSSSKKESTSTKFTLKSDTSLSSRYDFATSWKTPWKVDGLSSSSSHARTSTYPSASPNSIPWPSKRSPAPKIAPAKSANPFDRTPLASGSPRALDDEEFRPITFHFGSDDDQPFKLSSKQRGRHHQRGYFDIRVSEPSAVKRTPPGSPLATSSTDQASRSTTVSPLHRFNSFPPTKGVSSPSHPPPRSPSPNWPAFRRIVRGGSEESTPSVTTESLSDSSRSTSPDGTPPFESSPAAEDPDDERHMNLNGYSAFLNRFCFYTGSESLLDVTIDNVPRSHSASSIDGYFSPPPDRSLSPFRFGTPTRSASMDDVVKSGSSTPLAGGIAC